MALLGAEAILFFFRAHNQNNRNFPFHGFCNSEEMFYHISHC